MTYNNSPLYRVHGELTRAILSGDSFRLHAVLERRYQQPLDVYLVLSISYQAADMLATYERDWGNRLADDWTDGCWAMWLKNRLTEAGAFASPGRRQVFGALYVVLHTGFLSLTETPEQLENLRRRDPTKTRKGPDTPGIERGREPTAGPIDRTAARVTRWERLSERERRQLVEQREFVKYHQGDDDFDD